MLKEIYEQANIVKRIFKGRVDFEQMKLRADAFHGMQHENYKHIKFVGCGTSYYSGRLASLWAEQLV
ncbi:MAG: hypothetical protein H6765_01365 [Candidatus Peribacteria bacterium]|nr:MAG: hypothetical protein H6765_01365 [Candidatus Peribacteria bacterium]